MCGGVRLAVWIEGVWGSGRRGGWRLGISSQQEFEAQEGLRFPGEGAELVQARAPAPDK